MLHVNQHRSVIEIDECQQLPMHLKYLFSKSIIEASMSSEDISNLIGHDAGQFRTALKQLRVLETY